MAESTTVVPGRGAPNTTNPDRSAVFLLPSVKDEIRERQREAYYTEEGMCYAARELGLFADDPDYEMKCRFAHEHDHGMFV